MEVPFGAYSDAVSPEGEARHEPGLEWVPPGFVRIGRFARGGAANGNLVLLQKGDPPRVLKVYRRRRGALREALSGFAHRVFEGKRGVSPVERCATERESLALWEAEGFSVPRLLPEPTPDWLAHPSAWMEYTPGPLLYFHARDPQVPEDEREARVRALAAECARRHRRALELDQPLLVAEHPTSKHYIVSGQRLLAFDLEGGYLPGFPLLTAIGHELGGLVRSLWHVAPGPLEEPQVRAFLDAYGDRELARDGVRAVLQGPLRERLRRVGERRRRSRSKTGVQEALLDYLSRG